LEIYLNEFTSFLVWHKVIVEMSSDPKSKKNLKSKKSNCKFNYFDILQVFLQ